MRPLRSAPGDLVAVPAPVEQQGAEVLPNDPEKPSDAPVQAIDNTATSVDRPASARVRPEANSSGVPAGPETAPAVEAEELRGDGPTHEAASEPGPLPEWATMVPWSASRRERDDLPNDPKEGRIDPAQVVGKQVAFNDVGASGSGRTGGTMGPLPAVAAGREMEHLGGARTSGHFQVVGQGRRSEGRRPRVWTRLRRSGTLTIAHPRTFTPDGCLSKAAQSLCQTASYDIRPVVARPFVSA